MHPYSYRVYQSTMKQVQTQRENTQDVDTRLVEAGAGKGGDGIGPAEGSPTATLPYQRKINDKNGNPNLNGGGTPGNAGGTGRPAERVRLKATLSLDSQIGEIGKLLELVVSRAKAELQSDGSVHTALAALNQVSKLANTLTSIGKGKKVTKVVERPEWVGWTREAMEDAGIPPELVIEALKKLEQRLG